MWFKRKKPTPRSIFSINDDDFTLIPDYLGLIYDMTPLTDFTKDWEKLDGTPYLVRLDVLTYGRVGPSPWNEDALYGPYLVFSARHEKSGRAIYDIASYFGSNNMIMALSRAIIRDDKRKTILETALDVINRS